jgi:hypothetical protein
VKRLAIIIVVVGLAAVVWSVLAWRLAAEKAAFRQSAIEHVIYYRVKASFVVKDTQERIDFDYVAACAVVDTTYRDGDRSMDTLGVNPKSLIMPTRDGHAIQVSTPEACHGEVARGDIPPDLFPFTVFYENVADMSFGWGYASQDAYDNPKARMSFEGASIDAATYADWKAWRAKAEGEFKPIGKIVSPWGYSDEDRGASRIASFCNSYSRTPIPEAARALMRPEWEKQGRPEFWAFEYGSIPARYGKEWLPMPISAYRATPRTRTGGPGLIGQYSTMRDLIKRGERFEPIVATDIYPVLLVETLPSTRPSPDNRLLPRKLLVSDEWKGFIPCYARGGSIMGAQLASSNGLSPVGSDHDLPFYVNEVMIMRDTGLVAPRAILQNDQYILDSNDEEFGNLYH